MVTAGYVERSANVGGLRLSYQEWGSGSAPPIIMLHGFGVSGHMFDEFAERMQESYRLIALDQRGHGDSDWSEAGDYSRTAFVEDLEGFRKELGIERFILVGHSMGGLNAVAYSNRYPQHVRALVLVDVGPESAKEGVDNIVRFTRGPDELEFEEFVELAHRFNQRRTIENIRERMRHRLKPTDNGKYTWKFDRRFRQPESGLRIGSDGGSDDSWALFRGVRAPTLLIRGAESDVLKQETAERAATEMHRTRLVVVPGTGHSVPGDAPDAFTEAVREFLGDLEKGQLEPAVTDIPPLEQLLEEHSAARKRGGSLAVMVTAGVVAVLGVAGAGYLFRKRSEQRRQKAIKERPAPAPSPAAHIDIDLARERAAEVVARLGAASVRSGQRARKTLSEVDLERARTAAQEALVHLGEGSKQAALASRERVARVDRGRLKQQGSMALTVARGAGGLVLAAAGRRQKPKPKPRHRVARWRN